jgi:thiamine pyrophosphate-dependent acetolactate synthase large subunit-like protein
MTFRKVVPWTPGLSRLSSVFVQMELARQTLKSGLRAKALTELTSPTIDWVSLGLGFGVHSQRATSVSSFCEAMTSALQRSGPSLIEAVL